jgi:outer membrane protein TolC
MMTKQKGRALLKPHRSSWPVVALAGALPIAMLAARANAQEAPAPEGMERLSFVETVKRALAQNPTARVADEEIRRAHALMEQARAASLPTLTGTGTYTRLDSDRIFSPASNANANANASADAGAPSPAVVAHADSVNANLMLTVPLVNPKAWAQWSHAKDNIDVARASAADVRRQLALGAARAYLSVIVQKHIVDSSTRARDAAKAHFDFAHSRLVGGVGNKIDEVRAAQELATDETQLQNAQTALMRAREALGVLVGVQGPVDSGEDPEAGPMPTPATALGEAESKRADVIAERKHVEAAERVERDNWTDLSPYLTGTFSPFYQHPQSLTTPTTGWQATLVLTLPLYDGGLRYGQWHEREALTSQARANLEAGLRQAKSDVRTAFEAMRHADEALRTARDAARLAKEALDLANIAYRAGATTNLEVIDAERRERDAETQANIAEDTARNARLDLLSASGRFP